jgi:hypothetical protein
VADFHASTKTVSRSSGRSAVGAAAYRSGSCLTDERTGTVHDYTHKGGVEVAVLMVPEEGGQITRNELWNLAESVEKRKDARIAREWELGIPCELPTKEQRQALLQDFGTEYVKRYGCALDGAIHEPSKKGDQRNWHIHALTTTRRIENGQLTDKTEIELNNTKLKELGKPATQEQIEAVRELWAACCNRALERVNSPERVDHRSLADQRAAALKEAEAHAQQGREQHAKLAELRAAELERVPQKHVGWQATAMERRGIDTERGEDRRAAQVQAQQKRGVVAELRDLWHRGWAAIREAMAAKAKQEEQRKAIERKARLEREAQAAKAGEIEKFIRDHAHDFTTHAEGERWFHRQMEALSTYNETEDTARGLFERQGMPGDAGMNIGDGISRTQSTMEYWTKKAAQAEQQILKHRDPRSLFQKLKGEPDRDLLNLEATKRDALVQAQLRRDTLDRLDNKWQQEGPMWERKAEAANAERIARNESRRDQWLKLYDVREKVLQELDRRDRDPKIQLQRQQEREQQQARAPIQRGGRCD